MAENANVSPPAKLLSAEAFFAGWIAGGAGILVGHPFDTIKTAQQTQLKSKTSVGGITLLKSVLREYGWRGLFRGMTYPLVTYGAVNAVFFSGAEYTRGLLVRTGWAESTDKLSYAQIFIAGCVGGVAQLPIVSPTELVKVKLQDQVVTGRKVYSGSIDCTVKLWRQNGVGVFSRGISACCVRDVYNWGYYLFVFEFTRDKLSERGYHYITSELLAGGLAGFTSWASATPFDVVKSRMQASDHRVKLTSVIKELYAQDGLKAFTRGIGASSLRGIPSNAVTLFGYAELMRCFDRANKSYYS